MEHRWELKLFYDGNCPLCKREIAWLRKRTGQRVCYIDIATEDFTTGEYASIGFDRLMSEIHAMLPDGRLISGAEVFRKVYSVVGYSWLVALTRVPGLRQAVDGLYRVFARYRLRLTGRHCKDGLCKVIPKSAAPLFVLYLHSKYLF